MATAKGSMNLCQFRALHPPQCLENARESRAAQRMNAKVLDAPCLLQAGV